MRLPRKSGGAAMPESARTMMLVWKNLRMVKTGIAAQRVSPRDAAMMSEDIDISDTSNSAKRSCRQNISEGCTTVTTGLIPCGTMRPSISGRVRSLSDSAMLSSSREALMNAIAGWAKSLYVALLARERRAGFCPRAAGESAPLASLCMKGRSRLSSCWRDADINAIVAHLHVDGTQAIFRIAAVAAGLDVEFPPVPRADDVALF